MTVARCPKCQHSMVSTFVVPYNEFMCVPCGTYDEFFPRGESMEVSKRWHDIKKKRWAADLEKIGVERNSGECQHVVKGIKCAYSRTCKRCKSAIKREYQYYKKEPHDTQR